MSKIEKRLTELGIKLPESPKPSGIYVPARRTGNLVYTSGTDCRVDASGTLLHEGKLGSDLTVEQGQAAARQTMINQLASLKYFLGDLDRVNKIVKVLAFVNSSPGFVEHPYVINGGSEFLVEVFGEKGRHARSAIGTSELPFNIPVEIEMIVEIED